MPALHAALTARQVAAAELLLEMGTDVNEPAAECGSTVLLAFCHEGKSGHLEDVRIIQLALSNRRKVLSTNNFCIILETLFINYSSGSGDVVLLSYVIQDTAGMTPLHKAMRPTSCCMEEEVQVVQLLIDAGAKVDAVSYGTRAASHEGTPGTSLVDGYTPLQCAAMYGDCTVARMRLLVQHGADVNARTPVFGYTPLHMAARLGVKQAVSVSLVELGADVNIKCKSGTTARDLASESGFPSIVKTLDEHCLVGSAIVCQTSAEQHAANKASFAITCSYFGISILFCLTCYVFYLMIGCVT
jgi:ankyrin repeat protein